MVATAAAIVQPRSALLAKWDALVTKPLGTTLFGRVLGFTVPYAATIAPEVLSLDVGRAHVRLGDRRRVRNHLGSIHAAALTNLGELCANLALTTRMPEDARFIVRGMDIAFLKKARGRIEARCEVAPLDWSVEQDPEGTAVLTDANGDEVARLTVRWRTGPKR